MFDINGVVVIKGEDGRRYVLDDHLSGIELLKNFMEVVIYSDLTLTSPKSHVKHCDLKKVKLLRSCLALLPKFAKLNSSLYHYHPALSFFFREYRDHRISSVTRMTTVMAAYDGMTVDDLFDDFVAVMRAKSREIGLKKSISNWDGKFDKNLDRIVEIDKLVFEYMSRASVIRLDLEYRKAEFSAEVVQAFVSELKHEHLNEVLAFEETGSFEGTETLKGMVSFEEALADRKRLFANMKGKRNLFRHLEAVVWQMEWTPLAGYHIHVALIFKGSEVRKHEWLAQQIGEYWEQVITKGRGRFHNVNREFDPNSPNYGIGIIEHHDTKKRQNLVKALSYFVKKSQKAAVLPFKGCNLFGAHMVRHKPPTNRGRPRSDRGGLVLNQRP